MKKNLYRQTLIMLRFCIAAFILVMLSVFLFSFTLEKHGEDFLKQLGLSRDEADTKINNSLLSGSLDHYGIRNLKKILVNDRAAIVKDLATHAKQYANSDAFKRSYAALRENNKPAAAQKVETPEEMRASMITRAKEYVHTAEESLKKAAPEMKKIFEQSLEAARNNLKDAEGPKNKTIKRYEQNHEALKKMMQQSYDNSIKDWEAKYPANHLWYVKEKLQAYLDATADIDFNAQLFEKNGTKYFVNADYERKGNRWKMAYRAGKDAVEAGRSFARQWIDEIK